MFEWFEWHKGIRTRNGVAILVDEATISREEFTQLAFGWRRDFHCQITMAWDQRNQYFECPRCKRRKITGEP
jgi:hypothetical protein